MSFIRALLPKLTPQLRKGLCGKIAVIGGSFEYTGAPYFAAISALKLGADLTYVFCSKDAGPIIKSYSPELIVYPGLDDDGVIAGIERADAVVIGPGLGRDPCKESLVKRVILWAKEKRIPTVVDGDALWFLLKMPADFHNADSLILTPNVMEFSRLCETSLGRTDVLKLNQSELEDLTGQLSQKMGICVYLKGSSDVAVATDGEKWVGTEPGSSRRCGGQGDITAGTLATFFFWAKQQKESLPKAQLAAIQASHQLVRQTAREAFQEFGRSTTATDMISRIGPIIKEIESTCS